MLKLRKGRKEDSNYSVVYSVSQSHPYLAQSDGTTVGSRSRKEVNGLSYLITPLVLPRQVVARCTVPRLIADLSRLVTKSETKIVTVVLQKAQVRNKTRRSKGN